MKKIMRNLIYPALLFLMGIMVFSCKEQEEFGIAQSEKGFNLRVTPDIGSFDISKGDPDINFTVYTDNTNIDKLTVMVELFQFGSDGPTQQKVLTEVPGSSLSKAGSVVSLKLSDFVGAVGLTLEDLAGGDVFTIYNVVSMNDGRKYPDTLTLGDKRYVNIENSFITSSGTTSYTATLSFPVLCPFVTTEAIGTYSVIVDEFETYLAPGYKPELVAGPGPNQVTFKNLFGHPENYDVIIEVNPTTDVATVIKQPAWHSANFGLSYGVASVEGSGFFFSCTGFVTLELKHSVAAGTFGGGQAFTLSLAKD
jgi:hypothetical protein